MKKTFVMSLVCASVMAVTGCSDDDEKVYVGDPNAEQVIAELTAENEQLHADNQALQTKAEGYISTFTEQCAEAGYDFEYVDPNGEAAEAEVAEVGTLAIPNPAEGSCLTCHAYADEPEKEGPSSPHDAFGTSSCDSCHEVDSWTPYQEAHGEQDNEPAPVLDPHAPTFEQPVDTPYSGDINGKTGASGDYYYGDGSYLNADYLVNQLNAQQINYRWEAAPTDAEDREGKEIVTSLAAACQATGHEHMSEMFPNDGGEYVIAEKENAIGAKMVATVNKYIDDETGEEVQTPNIATFGWGLKKSGDKYYATMYIGKNNTCHNAIMNGDVRFEYYEYDPTQFTKTGLDEASRNRGARIIGKTDLSKTALLGFDWSTEVPGNGYADTIVPEDVDWSQVGACNLQIEVKSIIPLG